MLSLAPWPARSVIMRCILLLLLLLCLLTPSSRRLPQLLPLAPLTPGVPAGPNLTETDSTTQALWTRHAVLPALPVGPLKPCSPGSPTPTGPGGPWGTVSPSPPGPSPYLWPLDTLRPLLADPRGPVVSLDAPVSLEPRGSERSGQPGQSGKAAGPRLSLDAGVTWGQGLEGCGLQGGEGQGRTGRSTCLVDVPRVLHCLVTTSPTQK